MTVTRLMDYNEIEEELAVFLRNQNILTVSVRGVTTTTASGTWVAATSHLIAATVRNIRSITVDAVPLVFGTDYTVDYYYNDSGTRKCKITLNSAKSGAYSISYDYGSTDHITTVYPQGTLKISDYPWIAVELMTTATEETSIDKLQNRSKPLITITILSTSKIDINDYVKAIRQAFLNNKINFYYIPFITPLTVGPLLPQPNRGDKVFSRTVELQGFYCEEIIS